MCPLCKIRDADKKNTHYLTDKIIRSCLNMDGSNGREKGFYFDVTTTDSIEFNFQRNTNIEELEKELKRPLTDDEITKAKQNPYSVDYVFCTKCEAIFSDIEDEFIAKILPQIKSPSDIKDNCLSVSDPKLARLFFYIQVWRSGICVPQFTPSSSTMEDLRTIILNYQSGSEIDTIFPMNVTALETLGGDYEYTKNFVGLLTFKNPYIILMNDLIIQFYENEKEISFEKYSTLNDPVTYKNYINTSSEEFKIRTLTNADRKRFLQVIRLKQAENFIEELVEKFSKFWTVAVGSKPSHALIFEYIEALTKNGKEDVLNYTREKITAITTDFFVDKTF